MSLPARRALPLLALLGLGACKTDPDDGAKPGGDGADGGGPSSPVLSVPETGRYEVEGLRCEAHVVRTEGNVPHIYARDREDLAFAMGFTFAADRYFFLDLARRLSLGRVSELLGDAALETDKQARATGMTHVAQTISTNLTAEQRGHLEAYAAGVNAYIAAVKAGQLPPPSELQLAYGLLGAAGPTDLMVPFTADDLAGALASLVYELGFETEDVGNTRKAARAASGIYEDAVAQHDLREAAAFEDVYLRIDPYYDHLSAPGWALEGPRPPAARPAPPRVPEAMLARLDARMTRLQRKLRRDDTVGWGSNSWAVMADQTTDGRALLAGDGHLPLTVPSLFWQVGLDTAELGGGDTHQLGLGLPGFPYMAVGTNGQVAWSQTQLGGDITDWYREELQLGADGLPAAARFQGAWAPLTAVAEVIDVADVPALGSVGRTVTFTRYTTADGRWLTEVEGTEVPCDSEGPVVDLQGTCVSPGDTDGDGAVTGISFDYTGLDPTGMVGALDAWGHAGSVEDMQEAALGLVAYSQNIVAADSSGSVLYTSYQTLPCRGYLPRASDGTWADGADPTLLIDGTTYGGFTVPLDGDLRAVEGDPDPSRCLIPQDQVPFSIDPPQGWVATANNDPGGHSLDGVLENSPTYIGGPWDGGARMHRISELLEADAGAHSIETMAALQADHQSPFGRLLVPPLVAAIDQARSWSETDGPLTEAQARAAALYAADAARLSDARDRLAAWEAGDFIAASGVETFYDAPTADDVDDSVAAMIANAYRGQLNQLALDDEGVSELYRTSGTHARMALLSRILDSEGPGNPLGLAGWDPETEGHVFWDVLGTDEREEAEEVQLQALIQALDLLSAPPTGDATGGFGSPTPDDWRWGYRHLARFESVLSEFLGDDPSFSLLTDLFAINPERLPLADGINADDPRYGLPWFPRPGDTESVDASNFGWNTESFTYGSGPVFRMVIALGPDGVDGLNILPGGQSALTDSPYFDDQAALWLGNEAWPLRFSPEDVVAGATGREVLAPAGGGCD